MKQRDKNSFPFIDTDSVSNINNKKLEEMCSSDSVNINKNVGNKT
jgi:hypothetical protein